MALKGETLTPNISNGSLGFAILIRSLGIFNS
jgi:hypothetical protein